MKKVVKAFIEIGKDLDYDICSDPDAGVSFMILGQGKTIAEAKQDFYYGLEDMKQSFTKRGKEFPEVEFEFVYDVKSFLKYSPFPLRWLSNATGINQKQLSHYTTDRKHPSRVTLGKIQSAVHNFIVDYSQVHFV
jgi:hypothetical protein